MASKPMTVPKSEQETTIRLDPMTKVAHVYTCDPTYIRKMDKLVDECPDYICTWIDTEYYAKKYEMPMNLVSFRKSTVLSPEKKEALSERMRAMRASRLANKS